MKNLVIFHRRVCVCVLATMNFKQSHFMLSRHVEDKEENKFKKMREKSRWILCMKLTQTKCDDGTIYSTCCLSSQTSSCKNSVLRPIESRSKFILHMNRLSAHLQIAGIWLIKKYFSANLPSLHITDDFSSDFPSCHECLNVLVLSVPSNVHVCHCHLYAKKVSHFPHIFLALSQSVDVHFLRVTLLVFAFKVQYIIALCMSMNSFPFSAPFVICVSILFFLAHRFCMDGVDESVPAVAASSSSSSSTMMMTTATA